MPNRTVKKNYNLVIGFGAVIAIGLTMAIYKVLTSQIAANTLISLMIIVVIIIGIAGLLGLSFVAIRINHIHKAYKIEINAKLMALQTLQDDHTPEIAMTILYGITNSSPKEIADNPIKQITNWRIINDHDKVNGINNGDN